MAELSQTVTGGSHKIETSQEPKTVPRRKNICSRNSTEESDGRTLGTTPQETIDCDEFRLVGPAPIRVQNREVVKLMDM